VNTRTLRSEALLLLASVIWGFAFVAQRAAMDHMGPFLFNAVRFGIGALTLLPFARLGIGNARPESAQRDTSWSSGVLAGLFLFGGSSLQQAGMVTTTAGKAGFITALYVVLVPLLGLFMRHRPGVGAWIGVAFAVIGLYFLCITESLHVVRGDALVLGATLFWALHILLVGRFTPHIRLMTFACVQCVTCATLCGAGALATETVSLTALRQTLVPLLYAGVLSTGVAFTLQIIGQRGTPPAHAAILLALESVFAAVGGAFLLGESMTARQILGCGLMLCGVVVSQWGALWRAGNAGNLARNHVT
jgi:drug/metabolite transporter (DMT)-like permease